MRGRIDAEGAAVGLLAPTMLRVVESYLKSIFSAAVRDQLIASSPCVGVRISAIDRDNRVIPPPEQLPLLAQPMPTRLSAAVYVAAGCGLRLGELFGGNGGDHVHE
ncbi:hypothetical protein [Actinoplanes sp. M2I2]|uniref:hypothetical protein n=1 Tax=Actinoplanes sp. M2I2 TaxID=1734444 RepID=UPI0020224B79|nr:hypothetical protein [Actinoplanes sp. M2I2]